MKRSRQNLVTFWTKNQKEEEEKLHKMDKIRKGMALGNKIFVDIENSEETSKGYLVA